MLILKCQRLIGIAFMRSTDRDMTLNRIPLIMLCSAVLSVCVHWKVEEGRKRKGKNYSERRE